MAQDLGALRDPARLIPHLQGRTQRAAKDGKDWAVITPFINARGTAAILDDALGPDGWSFQIIRGPERRQGGSGYIAVGRLTLHITHGGQVHDRIREDIGSGGDDSVETGAKGAISDALKRCGYQVGVGRVLGVLGEAFVQGGRDVIDRGGKKQASDDAIARVVAEWKERLRKYGDAYHAAHNGGAVPDEPPVAAPEDDHDDHPATDDAPQDKQAPVDLVDRAAFTGALAIPDEADRLEMVERVVGYTGTEWSERWPWFVDFVGGTEQRASECLAAIGARYVSNLKLDATWISILTEALGGRPAAKEAA